MKIIPAIDIIGGKCVRLTQGDYEQQKTYSDSPLAVAQGFEAAGFTHLHLVDLDGARQKKVVNWAVLKQITTQTRLSVDFGGGVQSDDDVARVFDEGAKQITAGSIAVKNPTLTKQWLARYGSDKIILGADVKNESIAVSGWQESANISIFDFLESYLREGITTVICTDISKDGLLQGTATELYQRLLLRFPSLNLIASGGVSHLDDLHQLNAIGLWGAIVGKAIYEQKIDVKELNLAFVQQ